jgi:hypothetical protein
MLSDLPDGVPCFVDANVICYHIIQTPPLSDECARFIKRIERGAVRASTGTDHNILRSSECLEGKGCSKIEESLS